MDRYGRLLSACCAVHCFVMPLALVLLPLGWARWIGHPGLHLSIVAASLFVAAWAYARGARLHGRNWIIAFAALAAVAVMSGELFLEEAPWWHAGISGLAGLSLALGHHLNLRYCERARCDCPSHQD